MIIIHCLHFSITFDEKRYRYTLTNIAYSVTIAYFRYFCRIKRKWKYMLFSRNNLWIGIYIKNKNQIILFLFKMYYLKKITLSDILGLPYSKQNISRLNLPFAILHQKITVHYLSSYTVALVRNSCQTLALEKVVNGERQKEIPLKTGI